MEDAALQTVRFCFLSWVLGNYYIFIIKHTRQHQDKHLGVGQKPRAWTLTLTSQHVATKRRPWLPTKRTTLILVLLRRGLFEGCSRWPRRYRWGHGDGEGRAAPVRVLQDGRAVKLRSQLALPEREFCKIRCFSSVVFPWLLL